MKETEAQREKHRKEREWADFLAKIDKQADSPVFQACFGAFRNSEKDGNKRTKRV